MRRAWRFLRGTGRLLHLGGCFVGAGLDFLVTAGPRATFAVRSRWLHRWSGYCLRAVRAEVVVEGTPPHTGIVAANHLGYLDILVLASVTPQVFLSKAEVRRWPVVGWYAAAAGTQFIVRERRADVARINAEFVRIIEHDAVQTIFLEGTSTDGSTVLPFKSSLLEPAAQHGWPVTPAALVYTCEGGDPANDVCWWGGMGFLPHSLRLVSVDRITAHVAFGAPRRAEGDRKELARQLREDVVALKARLDARVAGR